MGQRTNGPIWMTYQRKLAREKEAQEFEDAIIQPDDPIPPRESEDENLVGNFEEALSQMDKDKDE